MNKKQTLTSSTISRLSGVTWAFALQLINDPEFLAEVAQLAVKYAEKSKRKVKLPKKNR